jgi:elongator complex protein 3
MKIPNKNEIRKPSKTLAGVTPIAVMCYPKKCPHGLCIYCPSLDVPQSYTPLSPPVIRAKILKYDSFKQVQSRLKAFKVMNHPTNKIEIIIMGGTFLSYDKKYQYDFVKGIYDALNNKKSKNLEEAKKLNQKSKHRCVALCIETRPDVCGKEEIKRMLEFGCTRVELGVQCLSDSIYKKVNRGHKLKDVVQATKLLKDSSFKVGYHMMPGLPYSTLKKDIAMFKKLFSDERFKPDQLKIYPCQVLKGSVLEKIYKKNKYHPYTKEQIDKLLLNVFKIIPNYCRVMRIMREIPPIYLVEGTTRIDLRRDFELELRKQKSKVQEIRFREIGFNLRDLKKHKKINTKLKIKKTKYISSKGEEIFLEFVNKDNILFGLLRLRFPDKPFVKELENSALVREVHVYGKSLDIGKKVEDSIQHQGLGKKLIQEAEKLVKEHIKKNTKKSKNKQINKIAIISGVGVRQYYEKLGYKLKGNYMIKEI